MDKKLYIALALVIVLIAVALIVTTSNGAAQKSLAPYINAQVPQSVVSKLLIPSSISNKIGIGSAQYYPKQISGYGALTSGGKPEILYIGANYCPYCAVTRWGMIIALLRFGNFTNLRYMASNGSDVYPNTPTFTFENATYSSPYITFVSVETTTRNRNVALQTPTPFENALFIKFNPQGGIPFIDFANQSLQLSAPILPSTLQGQNWNSTIANLTNANTSVSQAIVGSGDMFTAQICMITNNTPQSVCAQQYVVNIEKNNLG